MDNKNKQAPPKPAGKYFKVKFQLAANKYEPKDIVLSPNLRTMIVQRGVEVILPESYVDCAKQTRIPVTTRSAEDGYESGEQEIVLFPFETFGEATKEDFDKMLTEGSALYMKANRPESKSA